MILSRFWYVVLAFMIGAAVFVLYLGASVYNRAGERAMGESLAADSSAVGWFLKDDARNRSSALIPVVLDPEVRSTLAKASGEDKPSRENAEKARVALRRAGEAIEEDLRFDMLWAVDVNGRVIASHGDLFAAGEDWELGGFPVVADALHGWIRDDAWVWKGRILRVVARPVEQEVNSEPVGAIIGVRAVDDKFAQAVSKRTGAAVGFYAENARVASWSPEGFDRANLDVITQDLKELANNKDYLEKGRSEPRVLNAHLGVVYARLPGEAWELGAGYAVGRLASSVDSPFDFFNVADDADKASVPTFILIPVVLVLAILGLLFTFIEHTKPIQVFRGEVSALAAGRIDMVTPSKQTGIFRKVAQDLNDGIEKVVVKGGGARRAADLEQVLGPIPAQPKMSAFSVPGSGEAPKPSAPATTPKPEKRKPELPKPKPKEHERTLAVPAAPSAPVIDVDSAPAISPIVSSGPPTVPTAPPTPPTTQPSAGAAAEQTPAVVVPAPRPKGGAHETTLASAAVGDDAPVDEASEWRHVYEEFLSVKKQCGEPTANLSFDKFKGTLERNKAALVARHNCERVKFTVYVKDGKAALKASPVK